MEKKKPENMKNEEKTRFFIYAQRETTLRPPLRWRSAMGEPLTPIRNCRAYGISSCLANGTSLLAVMRFVNNFLLLQYDSFVDLSFALIASIQKLFPHIQPRNTNREATIR